VDVTVFEFLNSSVISLITNELINDPILVIGEQLELVNGLTHVEGIFARDETGGRSLGTDSSSKV